MTTVDAPPVTSPPKMLRAALDLAEVAGVLIAPAHCVLADGRCSCGKSQCASAGKHPIGADWQHRASSDPAEIKMVFARHPNANVGLLTGLRGGVVVLDIDGAKGEATLAKLEALHGSLPAAPTVVTARGRHMYFAAGQVPLHNRQGAAGRGLGPGLDFRAEGGFVVAPPSVHSSGITYCWQPGFEIGTLPLPALPSWIVELTKAAEPAPAATQQPSLPMVAGRAEKWASAALDRECQLVRRASEGERNTVLNTAAFNVGTLIGGDRLEATGARRQLLAAALSAGLTEFEALKTIRSGIGAGMKKNVRSEPGRDLPMNGRPAGDGARVRVAGVDDGSSFGPAEDDRPVAPTPSRMVPHYSTAKLFDALPTQRWCVPGLQLGPGRPTLIAGYGASAKTISVQALGLALASGRPIWNRFDSTPMVVLHIDYEQGYFATAKRYQRLALGHGIEPGELGDRLHYIEMPRVYLDQRVDEDEYLRVCDGVDLVIIDALRGAAPHTDENDSAFRASLDVLTWCSQRTGASHLVLHHAAKPKKDSSGDARTVARGSSAIFDACGCVLNFVAQPGGVKLVTQAKTPAEAEGHALEPFELVVEDVPTSDGNPTGGARVQWRKPVPVDESKRADERFERDAALILQAARRAPDGQTGSTLVARCGVSRGRAFDVLKALVDEGRLEMTKGPRASKVFRVPAGSEGR